MIKSEESARLRKTLGNNLRNLRISRNYSQAKFAAILDMDITQASVSAWECGTREPDLGTIFAISRIFSVPVSSLIPITLSGFEDDMKQSIIEFVVQHPEWIDLIEKAKRFDESQTATVASVINAISNQANKE